MDLPEYLNPPVVEVVCGALFTPVPGFTLPYLGRLWARFPKEFARPTETDPLPPTIESFPPASVIYADPNVFRVPRLWFMNERSDQVIQIQRDRFLCNWRKVAEDHEYPRYVNVIRNFEERLNEFVSFSRDELGQAPEFRQYELAYVNHIIAGDAWNSLTEIAKILPDFSWRSNGQRFLPEPEGIESRLAFELKDRCGRLRVTVQSALWTPDNTPMIILDMTARGFLPDRKEWFDIAHEWIVRGFTDLTGVDIQQSVWKRQK